MSNHPSILIIGAGITGLAAAWWLNKMGHNVTVLEADREVGGTIKTMRSGGWLVELGPNSGLETTPLIRALARDVGIEDQIVYGNEAANKRYVLRNGSLYALPTTVSTFIKSSLWSFPAKLRLLKEPFLGRAPKEETVAEFVKRRLGGEFLDYAVNPFVAGVFAGDPSRLSVQAAFPKLYALEKNYGGLVRGMIKGKKERQQRKEVSKDRARLFSFEQGMQTLPATIHKALGDRVKTGFLVESVESSSPGASIEKRYRVHGSCAGVHRSFDVSAVICAVPAYAAANLIRAFDPSLADKLNRVYYPPVAEVFLGFEERRIRRALDGFGYLVPRKENRSILGTIWSSTLFPNRAPAGHAALTTFVGGSRQPELVPLPDEDLCKMVRRELEEIMATGGDPVRVHVSRWDRAIPQYEIGHLALMGEIEDFEAKWDGLFLAGNYRGGISLSDCIINSKGLAERLASRLQTGN